jgi:hypothetical protein
MSVYFFEAIYRHEGMIVAYPPCVTVLFPIINIKNSYAATSMQAFMLLGGAVR